MAARADPGGSNMRDEFGSRRLVRLVAPLVLAALVSAACSDGRSKDSVSSGLPGAAATSPQGADPSGGPPDTAGSAAAVPPPDSTNPTAGSSAGSQPTAGSSAGSQPTANLKSKASGGAGATGAGARVTGAGGTATGPSGGTSTGGRETGGSGSTGTGGGATSGSGAPGPAVTGGAYKGEVGVTKDTITVGVYNSQSGPYAAILRDMPRGWDLAFKEANDQGGVNGRKIVMKVYDDGSFDPTVIAASFQKLRSEAFMGTIINATPVLPLVERFEVPFQIATGIYDDVLKSKWSYGWLPFTEYQAMHLMPGYLLNRLQAKGKKLGLIYDQTPDIVAAQKKVREKFPQLGLNFASIKSVSTTPSSCVNEVSDLQAKGVEIVFLFVQPLAASCVLRDARTIGFRPTWTGTAVSWNSAVVNVASGGATEDAVTFGHMRTLETPCGDRWRKAVAKYYDGNAPQPEDTTMMFYFGGWRIVDYLRAAGADLTRKGYIDAMERLGAIDDGCLPPPTLGPGERRGPQGVTLMQARGNVWVTVDPNWTTSFGPEKGGTAQAPPRTERQSSFVAASGRSAYPMLCS